MSGWKAKRFWSEATVAEHAGGYTVQLDSRSVKTPAKALLVVPTRAMATAIADEWGAVDGTVDPRAMPVTRSANAAIDKVAPQFAEVAEIVAAYGASDLLCYRDANSDALSERQARAWDPMLDWAAATYGARLEKTRGIIPVPQPEASLRALNAAVLGTTAFQLTALHDLVSLSGSLVLGLAATDSRFDISTLWASSRIDEDWQAEHWGEDEQAVASAASKRGEFEHARRFWTLSVE
ncbi:MAG: ATPase [Rhodobacteraceae bacterium]|nr:ATPase [Paracoccaceae bacterium]